MKKSHHHNGNNRRQLLDNLPNQLKIETASKEPLRIIVANANPIKTPKNVLKPNNRYDNILAPIGNHK